MSLEEHVFLDFIGRKFSQLETTFPYILHIQMRLWNELLASCMWAEVNVELVSHGLERKSRILPDSLSLPVGLAAEVVVGCGVATLQPELRTLTCGWQGLSISLNLFVAGL